VTGANQHASVREQLEGARELKAEYSDDGFGRARVDGLEIVEERQLRQLVERKAGAP
jgi:hypothetical protein